MRRDKNTMSPAFIAEPEFDVRFDGMYGDAAAWNASNDPHFTGPGLGFHEFEHIGDTIRGKPVLPLGENTPGTVNWQIDYGIILEPHKGVLTYAFTDSAHMTGIYNSQHWQEKYGFTEHYGYSPFTEVQRAGARQAMSNWDELVAVTFKEVNGQGAADITLANTFTGPAQAHAYIPYNWGDPAFEHIMGDVWTMDPFYNGTNAQMLPGQYGLQTLNHEIGHSLGLSHPGSYDFGDDQDGDGEPDPITYEGDAFYFQDSHQYSIMSYFDAYETGAQNVDWNLMRYVYPSTPMIHDVAIIQSKYGFDMTTRTGNSTYGFNATADVTNEAMRFKAGEMFTMFTIWDAGGNDTLDLSGYHTPSIIDLRPGSHSSAGGWGAYNPNLLGVDPTLGQINANNALAGFGARTERLYQIYFNGDWSDDGGETLVNEGYSWKEITGTGEQYLMEDNIGIAYGAIIENAKGGHGDDRINGNQVNNQLTGNGGRDTFIFANDGSVDTIMDFKSGFDRIDLSEVPGLNASKLSFSANQDKLFINTDNDAAYEMTIIVKGDDVNILTDIIF